MAEPNKEAPGEVRSNLQVVVRVVLVIAMLALLIGLGFALVRLISRPDVVEDAANAAIYAAHLAGSAAHLLQAG